MPTLSPIVNPYREGPLFLSPKDLDVVHARVSSRDHAYVNSFFPCINGKDDKILSILYAKFVAELRAAHATDPSLEPGYGLDHPTHELLQRILNVPSSEGAAQRSPAGRTPRVPCAQHDAGPTSSVCAKDGPDEKLGTVSQGRDEGNGDGGKETSLAKGVVQSFSGHLPRIGPSGRPVTVTSQTLLAKLEADGIL